MRGRRKLLCHGSGLQIVDDGSTLYRGVNDQREEIMIRQNHQNRKSRVDLSCPGCGMKLTSRMPDGYVMGNETYCCRGCAEGTGCTCHNARIVLKKAGNRPGHLGQRNPENRLHDRNFNEEINTSGRVIGPNKQETRKAPARIPTRGQLTPDGRKTARSQSEERPSTREQARGRSELRGKMNKTRVRKQGAVDRLSRTASKSR
jgi:hypothetical protein